ncbi:alpha-N-acetylglucosaminidase [Pedobacter sandarakinus]|uniref:alpha-N-acetylglucosaminidase n=1 Tax=Pedobacter sandarakinus TaxID=353156 RepID=UPI00224606E9|nr:alpha-N-acetylglucosaminidase [Pedobacter sandarakinus]MCX2575095.1 alpha-N-acetylglucosaminidase [Pedobacter sandarakinus]
MRLFKTLSLLFFCFPLVASAVSIDSAQAGLNKQAVEGLIKRMLPEFSSQFKVEELPAEAGKDVFEIVAQGDKIVLRGNNGVSVASAFNYYLKHIAHCQITWNGSNKKLSLPLPRPAGTIRKVSPHVYRYYLNYCTFNYSMSWWDWKRWQWEIDWMAMNGINTPLALTGQNIIHFRVYKSLGFTSKDLEGFFSGPAYFSWFWMGNLDGWGGPLPETWMLSHEKLQKQIVAREREFGMKPILPAFTGHVPPTFKDRFPDAKLIKTSWNNKFPEVYLLNPEDPLFTKIGSLFIEAQKAAYGTDHLYSADTFNENKPPSNDPAFLTDISKKVYASMASADPKAVWIMQGWLFHFSANFWKEPQIKAMLSAVPNDKMIILDLWSERHPLWKKTDAYYGKPWIWNMLSNFGGNISMQGKMKTVAEEPARVRSDPQSGKMMGIGLTPEGIEQNPVMYDLMMENVWEDKPIPLDSWLQGYAQRRYGKKNADAQGAWEYLRKSVYSDTLTNGGPESIICARPTFSRSTRGVTTRFPYDNTDLMKAWKLLIKASPQLANAEGFQYDLVDVSRQVLANYATYLQQKTASAYRENNLIAFRKNSTAFIQLIDDMDVLLKTRKDFLLGEWLNSAKSWGTTQQEMDLYERNARNLITLWGDENSTLREYACKQWSGLLKGFYKPRWESFFKAIDDDMTKKAKFDEKVFDSTMKKWEWKWVNAHEKYSNLPAGDPVSQSRYIYQKYYAQIENDLQHVKLN